MVDNINKISGENQAGDRRKNSSHRFNRRFSDQIAVNDDANPLKQRADILSQISPAKLSYEDTILLATQEKDDDLTAYLPHISERSYLAEVNVDMTEEEHQYFFDFMKRPLNMRPENQS